MMPTRIRRTRMTIILTALFMCYCALLGAVPLALGIGASHDLRQPFDITIVGLFLSQFATAMHHPGGVSRGRHAAATPNRRSSAAQPMAGMRAMPRSYSLPGVPAAGGAPLVGGGGGGGV